MLLLAEIGRGGMAPAGLDQYKSSSSLRNSKNITNWIYIVRQINQLIQLITI